MKKTLTGSALALLLSAHCAQAQSANETNDESEILALGFKPDAHGPAGTMADHVHKGGDLMVGLMWMHEDYRGANRSGTAAISDAQIAAAGYTTKADAMTMDMAMLHIMYAPSDRVTLMLVPSWMRMGMTMKGLPMAMGGMTSGMSGHMLMPGETMSHSAEGIGDTQFGALVSLSRRPQLSAHAGLVVSAPTGNVTRKSATGGYLHYMMQGGSGTWDLNPSLTFRGAAKGFGWGAQLGYVFRAEDRNEAGFRFGDRFTATGWVSKAVSGSLSLSTRFTWSREGAIQGHYNGAHNHAAPPDRQGNYGGQRLDGSLGFNALVGKRVRIGGEASLPLYQKVNGIQLPKKWGVNVSTSLMF